MHNPIDIDIVARKLVEDFISALTNYPIIAVVSQKRFDWVAFGLFLQGFNGLKRPATTFIVRYEQRHFWSKSDEFRASRDLHE